jgi:hypothetical protein
VYIYYITAAENAISSMLSSSCQDRLKKRDKLLMEDGGKGVFEKPNQMTERKPGSL